MRLLVVGGGIAGAAAALALHKAGFDVAVHEAHPDAAEDIGAFPVQRLDVPRQVGPYVTTRDQDPVPLGEFNRGAGAPRGPSGVRILGTDRQ